MTNYKHEMTSYIHNVVNEIVNLEGVSVKDAFFKLINYISVHSFLGADVPSILKSQTAEFLDAYIDIEYLKTVKFDFLGEFYFSIILQKRDLFPCVICDTIKSEINETEFPKLVMVSDIKTGNKAIQLNDMPGGSNTIMYATTNDIETYRICMVNRHLFNLPLFVLYIDPKSKKRDRIDISTSSINWTYANRWNPTSTSLLKTIS